MEQRDSRSGSLSDPGIHEPPLGEHDIGHALGGDEAGWDPELAEQLYAILYLVGSTPRELDRQLQLLEVVHHDAVYATLIHLLSSIRLDAAEARRCWTQILQHCESMEQRLGTPVDLRVALISYFIQVNRKLENPKIIEMKLFEQTRASVYRDELTGLYNYRFFAEYLGREIQRSQRFNTPLSLVMVDIDHFKAYNDRHGHEAGNAALAAVARFLRDSLRKSDIAARYGGEEFALVLPETSKVDALAVAEAARQVIAEDLFETSVGGSARALTVSMGIATYPADADRAGELVRRADRAMYVAKTAGRNQVQLYGQSRRSFLRVKAALTGHFSQTALGCHPMTTVNVSEGGLLFLCGRQLPVGSLLDLAVRVPGTTREVHAAARVVHAVEREGGTYETAVRIIDMALDEHAMLAGFIKGSGVLEFVANL